MTTKCCTGVDVEESADAIVVKINHPTTQIVLLPSMPDMSYTLSNL